MNSEGTIRRLAERQAARDSVATLKNSIKREKSLNESLTEYHQPGYGLHFCLHGKTYYELCSNCKRTRREVERNLRNL